VIRGWFDSIGAWPAPRVRATVSLHGMVGLPRASASISFLVDTGSGISAIHARDAVTRVGIPAAWLLDLSRWRGRERVNGIGGDVMYFAVPCRYGFSHSDDHKQEIDAVIRVAEVIGWNGQLSSVLGWDVPRHFRLTADLRARELFLE